MSRDKTQGTSQSLTEMPESEMGQVTVGRYLASTLIAPARYETPRYDNQRENTAPRLRKLTDTKMCTVTGGTRQPGVFTPFFTRHPDAFMDFFTDPDPVRQDAVKGPGSVTLFDGLEKRIYVRGCEWQLLPREWQEESEAVQLFLRNWRLVDHYRVHRSYYDDAGFERYGWELEHVHSQAFFDDIPMVDSDGRPMRIDTVLFRARMDNLRDSVDRPATVGGRIMRETDQCIYRSGYIIFFQH